MSKILLFLPIIVLVASYLVVTSSSKKEEGVIYKNGARYNRFGYKIPLNETKHMNVFVVIGILAVLFIITGNLLISFIVALAIAAINREEKVSMQKIEYDNLFDGNERNLRIFAYYEYQNRTEELPLSVVKEKIFETNPRSFRASGIKKVWNNGRTEIYGEYKENGGNVK